MADEKHGCQFILIGIGDLNNPCEDEDAEVAAQLIADRVPFQINILRGGTADAISETLAERWIAGEMDPDQTILNKGGTL